MVLILLFIILILLIGAWGVIIDNNRKVTKIANKMDIFDIEDKKIPDEEIEKELENYNNEDK
ncbi:hypothetical protein [Pontibacillus marinus]|uniref:Uncharacterized protein n=1 Tax=Pontibacillus marinus BH030004 = DSM 16465 TaxID=1385511 RepID=A0A0A5GAC3_9BACI|nr:hypothetical protein [Pontibacillus marinus]KGX90116.1 hypothetical protein N783_01100 [Pontibacillus marinus BH030004 = DSM 16465]